MSELFLKEKPTLQDIQQYIAKMKIERGHNTEDKAYEAMLLAEEVGELISAIRKTMKGGGVDVAKTPLTIDDVKDEIADVLIFLLSIANMHDINVEEAFRQKEEKNKKRTWKRI